jgi:phosphonate transport system substrate-binding protein
MAPHEHKSYPLLAKHDPDSGKNRSTLVSRSPGSPPGIVSPRAHGTLSAMTKSHAFPVKLGNQRGAISALQLAGFLAIALVVVLLVRHQLKTDVPDPVAAPADTRGLNPRPFILGFLPSQRATELMPDAKKLGAFLEQQMGRPVEVVVPTSYEPLIEGLRFGHVHAAFIDGGPGWIAHKRTGAEVVLAEVKDGGTFYWAEAFVRADSDMNELADVMGKRLAFTSRTGSSGFLMPIGSLIADGHLKVQSNSIAGLEEALRKNFAATIDAGGYKQAMQAVLEGRADVAFGAHDGPARFLEPAEAGKIRTLHRFGRIPSHAIMVAGNLSPEVVESFTTAMLALNEPENLPLLQSIYGVDGLQAANTADHLGEFGRSLSQIPGIEQTLLNKVGK